MLPLLNYYKSRQFLCFFIGILLISQKWRQKEGFDCIKIGGAFLISFKRGDSPDNNYLINK